jgi:hypothetical protein
MQVESARDQFLRLCYDLQSTSAPEKQQKQSVAKPFTFEGVENFLIQINSTAYNSINIYKSFLDVPHSKDFTSTPEQPPEITC